MKHTLNFLITTMQIICELEPQLHTITDMISIIKTVKSDGGRLFILGMGGSAGHASHAANDFRKLCGVQTYSPTDNVSELTARANDEGLNTIFTEWLKVSQLNDKDCIFIFSVGGGNIERNVSMALVEAINLAKERGSKIIGIVGRDGGYTAKNSNACVIIPITDPDLVTPHTEGMQAVLWHLMVSSPELQENKTKW